VGTCSRKRQEKVAYLLELGLELCERVLLLLHRRLAHQRPQGLFNHHGDTANVVSIAYRKLGRTSVMEWVDERVSWT
jgi:hypothetical protein